MFRLFDFKCYKCGNVEEHLVESNKEIVMCSCGEKMTKLLSAPPFHLKGNNWAKDNYGLKK